MVATARDPLLPTHWFNILHDRPQYVSSAVSRSRLAGATKPAGHSVQLQQPLSLARQSLNTADRFIPIPDEVLDLYAQYRPTPLRRAVRLEERLGANARIYYKYEGANLTGSHKLNTALAQAYYYSRAGVKRIVTGTAAGQWGTALAYACQVMNLGCTVFMVRSTLRQKPIRGEMMRLFGAVVHESPSDLTEVGRKVLKEDPAATGTQAVANGEALALAGEDSGSRFAVGSGENSVLLHQTVIGQEAISQMALLGEFPDCVIASMGAGSNFGGIALPFARCGGGLREADSARRRRVHRVSEADTRSLPLRPERRSGHNPDHQGLLARQHLRAAAGVRGRTAAPQRRAAGERHARGRLLGGDGHRPAHFVPGRHALLRD